jgi:hypothetical protein
MRLCLCYFTDMESQMSWSWMEPRHKLKGDSGENCVMQAAIPSRLNPTHNPPTRVKELCVNLKRVLEDKCCDLDALKGFGMTA